MVLISGRLFAGLDSRFPEVKDLRSLVLAGGYGTRLGALALNRSKVLLPVAGRPVVDYLLDRVCELPDLHEIVVVTNQRFHGDFVEWASASSRVVPIRVLNDGTSSAEDRLGAVGDVLYGIENAGIDDDLLVVAGDNLCDFDLRKMATVLQTKGSVVAVYDVGDVQAATKFNNLRLDDDGRIRSFEEKPANPTSSLVAVAIYLFRKADLGLFARYRDEGHNLDVIGGFVQWAHRETPMYACVYDGHWWDIGDPEIYAEVNAHFGGSVDSD
jgi:glucose-1-phosphate thymidylyltransferase